MVPDLDIGLPTGALRVEDDWMNIDLTCAVRNECNATRSPVRLHPVTMPAEPLQQVIERQMGDVDGEIEIAVDALRSLSPFQSRATDRDASQRYVCHTWLRMSCQTPVIRRGSEAQRGQGDAQPAAGDRIPYNPSLKCPMRVALTNG